MTTTTLPRACAICGNGVYDWQHTFSRQCADMLARRQLTSPILYAAYVEAMHTTSIWPVSDTPSWLVGATRQRIEAFASGLWAQASVPGSRTDWLKHQPILRHVCRRHGITKSAQFRALLQEQEAQP
jgi:hypothetical protein